MQGLFPGRCRLWLIAMSAPPALAPPTLVLFAKFPVAGYAKTRLIPAIGAEGAAKVHRHLTERTVTTLLESGAPVEVRYAGASEQNFREWLGDKVDLVEQVEGG